MGGRCWESGGEQNDWESGRRVGQVGAAGVLECREGGIVEEYILENAVNNPTTVPEVKGAAPRTALSLTSRCLFP